MNYIQKIGALMVVAVACAGCTKNNEEGNKAAQETISQLQKEVFAARSENQRLALQNKVLTHTIEERTADLVATNQKLLACTSQGPATPTEDAGGENTAPTDSSHKTGSTSSSKQETKAPAAPVNK